MKRSVKQTYTKQRIPIIVLICEGRNKTERLYFNHFNYRAAPYNLKIEDCESTDIESMVRKALHIWDDYQLDPEYGDHLYCLIDLDLNKDKLAKYLRIIETKKYRDIEIILSNPCFETWLLYYFTDNPKVVSSSQKAKIEISNYIDNYTESTDVIKICKLDDFHKIAIERSITKNLGYDKLGTNLIDKNPYSEVQQILLTLGK